MQYSATATIKKENETRLAVGGNFDLQF